jgi:hypothetical protein
MEAAPDGNYFSVRLARSFEVADCGADHEYHSSLGNVGCHFG